MKLYADAPGRRARQTLGDLLLVAWVVWWSWVGSRVHDVTLGLARPGEQISRAGDGLARQLRGAGRSISDLPLVGDAVQAPFRGAGDAAAGIARAGTAQAEAVHQLAAWLGLAVAAVPVLVVVAVYLPLRWRFVREATAGRRYVDAGADLDLFALRAMAHQPLHRLARVSDDPAGAWRAGDRRVISELAGLELREVGLAAPAAVPAQAAEDPPFDVG